MGLIDVDRRIVKCVLREGGYECCDQRLLKFYSSRTHEELYQKVKWNLLRRTTSQDSVA